MPRILSLLACLATATPLAALAQDDEVVVAEARAVLPTFPPRVVAGPPYNGQQELIFDALAAPLLAPLAARTDALSLVQLLRHRSLRLTDHGGGGLIDALWSDAEAKGWTIIPELTVNGTVFFQSLGLERRGATILVLAFGDAVMPRADNPGASVAIAEEAVECPEEERAASPEPGLAPCAVGGFVPVWVWTDLPRGEPWDELGPRLWLDAEAPTLADDPTMAWDQSATWEEVLLGAGQG